MHGYPESPVFYRSLVRDFPLAVRGDGCWIEDENGKRYLDAVGGAYVATIGHGVGEIGEAMARQASRLAYVSGAAFTNEAVEELCAKLVGRTKGMDRAYIVGSGSEAIEVALKLARQHWVERGRTTKHRVIALNPSYHGNTLLHSPPARVNRIERTGRNGSPTSGVFRRLTSIGASARVRTIARPAVAARWKPRLSTKARIAWQHSSWNPWAEVPLARTCLDPTTCET